MILSEITERLSLEKIVPNHKDMVQIRECFNRNFGLPPGMLDAELTRTCIYYVLRDNGKIVGMYVLDPIPLPAGLSKDPKWEGRGVKGTVLALDKKYRNTGYGREMKDLPQKLGYDYVWGFQLASLNNIDHWLKRREIVYKNSMMYVTAQRFT